MQQKYSKQLMIGLGVAFIIVPSIFVGLRIWARMLRGRSLKLDDYLCLGALAVGIVCSALQLEAAINGQLGQHQTVGPDGKAILDDPRFLIYERTKFAVNVLAVVGLGLIKSSILIFYKNIFNVKPFRKAVYVMLAIVVAWTISYFFSNLFTCYPVTALIEPFYGNKCINAVPMWLSVVATDLIVDVGILIMPVPMVLRLQMPLREKLGILGMFLLGATVCAISAARLATLVQISNEYVHHINDVTYYTSPVFYWTNIEMAVAVVSACLPTLRPIWQHFHPKQAASTVDSYGLSGRSKGSGAGRYTEVSGTASTGTGTGTGITITTTTTLKQSTRDESQGPAPMDKSHLPGSDYLV